MNLIIRAALETILAKQLRVVLEISRCPHPHHLPHVKTDIVLHRIALDADKLPLARPDYPSEVWALNPAAVLVGQVTSKLKS